MLIPPYFARLLISELKFRMVLRCMSETQKQTLNQSLVDFQFAENHWGVQCVRAWRSKHCTDPQTESDQKGLRAGITAVTSHLFVDITKQNCVINVV